MADPDEAAPSSRSDEFQSGIVGGGSIASALPQVAQANPAFDGSGSNLTVPNEIAPVNGESDSTYLTKAFPAMAKGSPMTAAQKGEGEQ